MAFSIVVLVFLFANAYSFTISDLSSQIEGKLLTESSPDYEVIRQQFDLSLSKFPSIIIQCETIQDVKLSLQYTLDNNLDFVVRSGKHSFGAFSTCNQCVMIDLRLLNNIKINERAQSQKPTVSVQPGVLLNELIYALEYNTESGKKYWVPAGIENVGIGGHIHGGGWGIGIRKYGMAMDNLVAAKVVTVDHKKKVRIKRASLKENPELFYCIRGTIGPSCGIVVEYKLKIYEQNVNGYTISTLDTYGTTHDYTAELDKLTVINEAVSDQRDHLVMNIHAKVNQPINLPFITTRMFYSFYDGDVVEKEACFTQNVLNSIDSLGGIVTANNTWHGSYLYIRCIFQMIVSPGSDLNVCHDREYLKVFTQTQSGHRAAGSLFDTEQEYDEFVGGLGYQHVLNQVINECPAAMIFCGYYTNTWGGKVNDIESDLTAFPWRDSKFAINYINHFPIQIPELIEIASQAADEWMEDTFTNGLYHAGYTPRHGYANYPVPSITDQDEYMKYYYGDNAEDLIESKCIWDPLNIFTNPQGIPVNQDCVDVRLCGNDFF